MKIKITQIDRGFVVQGKSIGTNFFATFDELVAFLKQLFLP